MKQKSPCSKRKYLRTAALLFGVLFTFIFIWYATSRIRSLKTPISVYSFQENIPATAVSEAAPLKLASYNIAHGRGGKYGAKNRSHKTSEKLLEHLDKIAEQIAKEQPDIIVLEEVDFSSDWSFNINQAEYIGRKCGYGYILEQKNMDVSFPFYRLCFGNALLSRYPITRTQFIDFPPYSELEKIVAGNHDGFFCEIALPSGPLGIFGIHWEYRSEEIRVRCAELLDKKCSALPYPVIALGDFNSTPTGLPKSGITGKGQNAMTLLFSQKGFVSYRKEIEEKNINTFPSEKPDRLIDWIIGRGIPCFSNARTIKSTLSDHLMIVTEIDFTSQKQIQNVLDRTTAGL